MNVIAPYSVAVLTRSYVPGPERCPGITPLLGNWTTKSIDAAWLVSVMAFYFFFGSVGPFFPYIFFDFFIAVFKGFEFLRTVLWPVHLCLCPRRARLNWAARFWVPTCLC